MDLLANPRGKYHFLSGIDPYSCGVVADPGHEVVHATLQAPLPWRDGFELIDAHLATAGRGREALCGIQLRSPEPFTMAGFKEFNSGYIDLLKSWGLYMGDLNPLTPPSRAELPCRSATRAGGSRSCCSTLRRRR